MLPAVEATDAYPWRPPFASPPLRQRLSLLAGTASELTDLLKREGSAEAGRLAGTGPSSAPTLTFPEQRPDVLVRATPVRRDRVQLQVNDLEVLVEHLIDRRVRPRVAPLVHLVQQPSPRRLRLRRGLRPGRDHLDEVVPTSVTGSVPA
jgi:hypothetical protein